MVVEFLGPSKIQWGFAGATGDPARELARLARERGAGTVVVGASALGWRLRLRRLGHGSVVAQLAYGACSALLVPYVVSGACSRNHPRGTGR